MTQRQWLLLQVICLYANNRVADLPWAAADSPWAAVDSSAPTKEEIDELVQWLSDNVAPPPDAKFGDWEPTRVSSTQLGDRATRPELLLGADGGPAVLPMPRQPRLVSLTADETLMANAAPASDDDDEETLLHIEYKCPKCSHEWSDTWTSAVDAECPECGTKDISPVEWEEAGND